MIYEIRRAGQTVCFGSAANLGYSPGILKDLEKSGHHLYCDGKRVKKPPRNGHSEGGRSKKPQSL